MRGAKQSPGGGEKQTLFCGNTRVERGAAVLIKDTDVVDDLKNQIDSLLSDKSKRLEMGKELRLSAKPNAAIDIVDEVVKLLN